MCIVYQSLYCHIYISVGIVNFGMHMINTYFLKFQMPRGCSNINYFELQHFVLLCLYILFLEIFCTHE
jgi:hypothetical protein